MPSHHDGQKTFAAAVMQRMAPADIAALGITATGDIDRRFAVYRNTFAHTLTAALAARFPTVQRLVGADFFRAMAGVYVADHPPRSPVMQTYGADFPDFLRDFPPVVNLPYLPDVARIEVLRGLSYHAADATPLTSAAVQDALARGAEDAVLTLHPSLRILHSDHSAVSIWHCNQTAAPARPADLSGPEAALIFRQDADAVVIAVTPAAAGIVAALASGATLGTIAAADAAPSDAPIASIADALVPLLRHALITRVTAANNRSQP